MEQYIASLMVEEKGDKSEITRMDLAPLKGTTDRVKVIYDIDTMRDLLCSRITWVVDLSHVGFTLVKLLSKGGKVPGTIITGKGQWIKITGTGNTEIRNASAILPGESNLIKIRGVFHELGLGHGKKDPLTLSSIARKKWADGVKGLLYWVDNSCLTPDIYRAARNAYRGGYTYNRPGEYGAGVAVDINSLYPYVMISEPMPVGCGRHMSNNYDERYFYLYKINLKCNLKDDGVDFIEKVYAGATRHDDYILLKTWITSVDLQTIQDNYEMKVSYDDIIGFETVPGRVLFESYILPLYDIKKHSKGAQRQAAKLLQNGLSGSFGRSNHEVTLVPTLTDLGKVGYKYIYEYKRGVPEGYMPIAVAITAYGRQRLISDIKRVGQEHVIYSNTDSMFLTGGSISHIENADEIGEYKIEQVFNRAKIIGHCCYFLDGGDSVKVAAPGLNKRAKAELTSADYNRFKTGASFEIDGWKVAADGCKVPAKKTITIRQ